MELFMHTFIFFIRSLKEFINIFTDEYLILCEKRIRFFGKFIYKKF